MMMTDDDDDCDDDDDDDCDNCDHDNDDDDETKLICNTTKEGRNSIWCIVFITNE